MVWRSGHGIERRPRWVTYTVLGLVLLISAYPLYYTVKR
jgi:cellobiose transport system permease protein